MKFKVGDRVAVYDYDRFVGTIISTQESPPNVGVCLDNSQEVIYIHPQQCRKLVKKDRKRVWINLSTSYKFGDEKIVGYAFNSIPTKGSGWIEFIEVKKK